MRTQNSFTARNADCTFGHQDAAQRQDVCEALIAVLGETHRGHDLGGLAAAGRQRVMELKTRAMAGDMAAQFEMDMLDDLLISAQQVGATLH